MSIFSSSRRQFFATTGAALAGLALGARPGHAMIPMSRRARRTVPAHWLPDPTTPDALRALATQAIDAARQAGASFADIRIGEIRRFTLEDSLIPQVGSDVGYGVRVLVNGTWGFVHGQRLTADAVVDVARQAVSVAQGYAAMNAALGARPVTLAVVPVATGEWTTPVAIDPFGVPIDDQVRWMWALQHTTDPLFDVRCLCRFAWEVSTRIYASTEGALTTQHLTRGAPSVTVITFDTPMQVPGVVPQTGGFELVVAPDLSAQILTAAHEVIRRSELPVRRFDDEGRFPVVCDGDTMAQMVGVTLGCLVDSDRASGDEAGASGTTYLVPPAAVRAAAEPQCSPLVTVTADRAMPGVTAVRWDDEGVATGVLPLIQNGRVQNYLARRETAAMNGSASLMGCSTAPTDDAMPMVGGVHLGLTPSAKGTIAALTREITHGFLVRAGNTSAERGLSSGTINGDLYEIKQGQEVARVSNLQMAFAMRHWWRDQLSALGDAGTVVTREYRVSKGMPWRDVLGVASAPAALFTDVDFTRTDIKLS